MNRREAVLALLSIAATPLAFSQSSRQMPRIALVDPAIPTGEMAEGPHPFWASFLGELRRLGHIEGQTILIERWTGGGVGTTAAYAELALKVTASRPRLIVLRGNTVLVPVASATKEIPIVALATIPPDMRASLSRPGRNVTGIHLSFDDQQLYIKQVEILRDVAKPGAPVAWLGPPRLWDNIIGDAARKGAKQAGITLEPFFVGTPVNEAAIRKAISSIPPGRFGAVLLTPGPELLLHRRLVAKLLAAARLPGMGYNRYYAQAGLALSYGVEYEGVFRRAAHYVDAILKGADPATTPIEQPTRLELIVNMKTAKAIGLVVPQSVLVRADEVIQ